MRSTLKKSLYLGLAALSFASVAGAANNADAAKKTKPAKTYATASYQNIPDQGQSNVAYNVTGSNALFNKPGTVKGAKQTASKATMSDLASSKQNFMVYQTATTNRGSKYIKVVSFDKQYRGWIYAGNNTSASYGTGVQQINLSTAATPQSSAVYLKTPGQTALKSSPEGAQFNASSDNFSHTGFVSGDAFNIDSAQTVSKTGTTWYHLVDQNDSTINGWVPSSQVQLNSNNNYFNPRNDIKVNYTSNGQTIKTGIIDVSGLNKRYTNSGVVTPDGGGNGLASQINSNSSGVLSGTDYGATSFATDSSINTNTSGDNNTNAIQYVKAGDTINIDVNSTGANNGNIASHMSFNTLSNGLSAPSQLSTSSFNLPSLNTSDLASQMNGYNSREQVNMQRILGLNTNSDSFVTDKSSNTGQQGSGNNIFGVSYDMTNPNKLGVLYGNTQYAQSDIKGAVNDKTVQDAQNTNGTGANVDKSTPISKGSAFHYDYVLDVTTTRDNNNGNYGQNVQLYYKAVAVPGATTSSSNSNNTTTNY